MASKGVNYVFSATNSARGVMRQFEGGLRSVQKTTNAVQATQRSWNKGLSANRRAVQQLGFQVSDFAIQIAGGQSAMLAFVQQGGQVLQFFGPFGAAAAAALAIFGSLGIAFVKSGQGMNELILLTGVLESQFRGMIDAIASLKGPAMDALNLLLNNLDTIAIAGGIVVGIMGVRWVASMVAASGATASFRAWVAALATTYTLAGTAAAGAMVATTAWTGALRAARVVIASLGFPALIIGAAILIERLLALREATGSWGDTFEIVFRLIKEVFKGIWKAGVGVGKILDGVAKGIAAAFLAGFSRIAKAWDFLINGMAKAWNKLASTTFGKEMGLGEMGASDVAGGMLDSAESLKTESAAQIVMGLNGIKTSGSGVISVLSEIKALYNSLDKVDVGEWFGAGAGAGAGGGVAKAAKEATSEATKAAKEAASEIEKSFDSMQSSIANSMKSSFKAMLDGSKSLAEGVRDILGNILDQIYKLVATPIFNQIASGLTGSIFNALQLPSFEGGGMTGAGVRAGGLDGKGGKLALVHPNEEVVDYENGGRRGGGNTVIFQINTPDAASFQKSQRQITARAKQALG